MIKRIMMLAALCLMITACGGSLNNAIQSSIQSTKPQLDVETEKAFSGVNQVVIGSFNVGFDTFKTESVKAEGGLMGSAYGGKSMAKSTLTGVDKATMQAITDAAYNDFVQTLKAKGYTVASRNDLMAHDDFKDTNVLDNPTEVSEGGMLGGGTEALYFAPSSFGGIKPFMGDVPGVTGGFGWSNPSSGASLYAEKTGIPVLHVSYRVDFANAEKYGGWHTNTSSISVDQGLSLYAGSHLGIIGGHGGTFSTAIGLIRMNHPISSDVKFATITDSTSDTSKVVETATNVIGILGGIGSNISRRYEFAANPSVYKSGAISVLKKGNDLFVEQMKSLK